MGVLIMLPSNETILQWKSKDFIDTYGITIIDK